ncbi:hypothetical protein K438DRAFT_1823544 [Mycena galopus ATCC 62051]|nr:hypothetical protein K438DRAFT_1823544 [Mycena galopus ATCC 62051]
MNASAPTQAPAEIAPDPLAHEHPDGNELAGTKLWAVYISEAHKYDKTLVEGWKSDMEGLLIFAGLFSASLVAFIVESYKTLSPDQGAITIALLTQISRQLDPPTLAVSGPTSFSLACNLFWFLSLGFSLSCALIATLVEQWSRDFIQKTEMRPSPIIRARIFSYLYFGLQRFGMHTTVTFLPLLLHVSLLLFFAGLIVFLYPINTPLMIMAATLLGIMAAAYAYLTLLPMHSSDSPYRTPLSNVVWGLFQRLVLFSNAHRKFFKNPDEESTIGPTKHSISSSNTPTMAEVMVWNNVATTLWNATRRSKERDERDGRAIVWTMWSLTDNNELEPFVEALPDLIWGPNGRRPVYDDMINTLLQTQDIQLIFHIEGLLRSCDSGLLSHAVETHRCISCLKALWAIAYFLASDASPRDDYPVFDHPLLKSLLARENSSPQVRSHLLSTYSIVRWCGFCSLSAFVRYAISMLEQNQINICAQDPRPLLTKACLCAEKHGFTEVTEILSNILSINPLEGTKVIQQLSEAIEDSTYDVLVEYFRISAPSNDWPYHFDLTSSIIQRVAVPLTMGAQSKLKDTFIAISSRHRFMLNNDYFETVHHIDAIADMTLQLLHGTPMLHETGFLAAFLQHLNARRIPGKGVKRALGRHDPIIIGALHTEYLAIGSFKHLTTERTLGNIWLFCSCDTPLATFNENTISAISAAPQFPSSPFVMTVVKSHILRTAERHPPAQLEALMDRLNISASVGTVAERWNQANFCVLVEFLEHYTPSIRLDWELTIITATFEYLTPRACQSNPISASLQQRFSNCLHNLVTLPFGHANDPTIKRIMESLSSVWHHLSRTVDDPRARATLHDAFEKYTTKLSKDPGSSKLMRYLYPLLSELRLTRPASVIPFRDDDKLTPEPDDSRVETGEA